MPNPDMDNSIDVDRLGRSDAFPFTSAGQLRIGKATVGPSQPMRICQLKSKCIPSPSAGGTGTRRYRQVASAKGFIRNPRQELQLLFGSLACIPQIAEFSNTEFVHFHAQRQYATDAACPRLRTVCKRLI